jgi:hypothetical protein
MMNKIIYVVVSLRILGIIGTGFSPFGLFRKVFWRFPMKTLFSGLARRAWVVLWAVSAVLIWGLISCVPPTGAAGGNFTVFFSGDGSAKAIAPATIESLSYELELSGPQGETVSYRAEPGTTSVTLSLVTGKWTITVKAFQNDRPFGSGEITVIVENGSNQAVVPMYFYPVWYVAGVTGNNTNPGSEAKPLATVAEALERIKTDYAGDWSNNGGSTRASARIVISGTITEPAGTDNMVEISDNDLYDTYPPLILEGGTGGGTLDATGLSNRVLYITNADVTLGPGLTLTGGDIAGEGGGVYAENTTLTIDRATISTNTAWAGGGVYASDTTLIIDRATISANAADEGGGVYAENTTLTIDRATISTNNAEVGGGVYASDTTLIIDRATISTNTAWEGGGGVYFKSDDGTFTMNGGTISDNEGGGVYFESEDGTFTMSGDAAISGNKADEYGGGGVWCLGTFAMSGNAVISGNETNGNGGGVYVDDGTFTMSGNAVISGNQTTGSDSNGGGVYVSAKGKLSKLGGTIFGNNAESTFKNTAGSGNGHAVYSDNGPKKRNNTAGPGVNLDSTSGTNGTDPWI